MAVRAIKRYETRLVVMIFFWQVGIMIWQVDTNNWQFNEKIWQVDIIIWQVIAEIYHHRQVDVITWSFLSDLSSNDVHLSDLCFNLLDSLSTCKILFYLYDMVSYFCHHLSDNYGDLSHLMSSCQIFMTSYQIFMNS